MNYSIDLSGADAVVFVFEWTTDLQYGDRLDWLRLIQAVPRRRRVLIDCDGRYNDPVESWRFQPPHAEEGRPTWIFCDSRGRQDLPADAASPARERQTFLFHVYDPTWEAPLDFSAKEFGIAYVGHSKFRWHGMAQVLRAVEPVRQEVGRIGLFGYGWDELPDWAPSHEMRMSTTSTMTT